MTNGRVLNKAFEKGRLEVEEKDNFFSFSSQI